MDEESERLDALASFDVLGRPADAAYDRLLSMAADLFDVPRVSLSLVDRDRVWRLAGYGSTEREIPRAGAPCDAVVGRRELVVEPDVFFAGAPLATNEGHVIGAFAIHDDRPRTLDASQRRRLKQLAAFVMDRLERQRAQRALARRDRKLMETQKLESLGRLAGGVAHEFNNLLGAILGNTSLALREVAPSSGLRRNLTDIEEAARRAARLAQQMLAFSGRGHYEKRDLDLGRELAELGDLIQLSLGREVVLSVESVPGLPAIHADAAQMRQAVLNLVTNAAEAQKGRPGRVVIRTGTAEVGAVELEHAVGSAGLAAGTYVYLEVADDGPGCPADELPRLCDPFFSTKGKGRGLGLAAVVGILNAHGGALTATSRPEGGSRFRLLFSPGGAPDVRRETAGVRTDGFVLVVDDEDTVRNVLQRMLRGLGREALEASDGRQALDVLEKEHERIGTIMLDLTMPRVGGAEVLREVTARYPDMHVILMSGYEPQTVLRNIDRNGLPFLRKPFAFQDVAQVLKQGGG